MGELSPQEVLDPRIKSLYRTGSRFIAREADGSWGVAHETLHLLLLILRGSSYEDFSDGIWEIHGNRREVAGRMRGGATHVERILNRSGAAHAIVEATQKHGLRVEPFGAVK